MKKVCLFVFAVLFTLPGLSAAVPTEAVEAAIDRAAVQALRAEQEKYKGFNPTLSEEKTKQIPQFLQNITQRLNDRGYAFTDADVAEGLLMHLELSGNLVVPGPYTVQEMQADGTVVEKTLSAKLSSEGLLQKHALMYAFAKVMGPVTDQRFSYKSADFPQVTDWKEFHYLCQAEMDSIYLVLENLQNADDEKLSEVFCNIL